MIPATKPYLPNYLDTHVRPGLRIPIDLGDRAMVAQKVLAKSSQMSNWSYNEMLEWNRNFRKKNIEVVDGDFEQISLFEGEKSAEGAATLSRILDREGDSFELWGNGKLEKFIKLLNCLSAPQEGAGEYRAGHLIIMHDDVPDNIIADPALFKQYILQKDPSLRQWVDLFLKFESERFCREVGSSSSEDPIRDSRVLSKKSIEELKKLYFMTLNPDYIPQKMAQFVGDLKEKLNDPLAIPIEIAAFAHMRIVEIHPFGDGNGRTARLLMNILLKKFGLPPIYFYSEKEYLKAVKEGLNDRGSFAKFISRKIYYFKNIRDVAAELYPGNVGGQNEFIASRGVGTCRLTLAPEYELSLGEAENIN